MKWICKNAGKESMGMYANLPVGLDSFSEIRDEGYYYIDKTEFIKELLSKKFKSNLITRPRRFGKTLTMRMLEDFFDISRDSKVHFKGLKILEETELCQKWMNQWPVIFITLKSVEGLDFQSAYGLLESLVAELCIKYSFLEDSEKVDRADRATFLKLKFQEAKPQDLKRSLSLLTRMMAAHYGKPAILLIDEYDVPLAKANDGKYYAKMFDIVKALLGVIKTNDNLKFAVVTGCLRIAKESIFTGTNNFVTDSIIGDRFNEYIGFTEKEVKKFLADTGFSGHMEEIRAWYDGYRFGNVGVYCPWDVLYYVADLQDNPVSHPKAYWANTSSNSIIRQLLKKAGRTTKTELEKLMDGENVYKKITDQMTYDELDKNTNNLWSVLYLTGYLTGNGLDAAGRAGLCIPNQEIREIFISHISEWFADTISAQTENWDAFCKALENGDAASAETLFTGFLNTGISIRDTAVAKPKKENFYHGVLLGLMMANDGWDVSSNHEDGDGYSDIHVEAKDSAFVIEVKYGEDGHLDAAYRQAVEQIRRNRYAEGLIESGYPTVYIYGIACYKKHCKITMETYSDGNWHTDKPF